MWSRSVTERMLLEYQQHEHLYNARHPDYQDRVRRAQSLSAIYEKLKALDTNVTIERIKTKIHGLRSQYLKEVTLIKASKTSGAEVMYEPKLWCFSLLGFLAPYVNSRPSTSNPSDLHDTCSPDRADYRLNEQRKKKAKKNMKENEDVEKGMSCSKNESDRFELLGLAWAAKLRQMQPRQSKLAERLISEVLFQGDLEMLTIDTTVETKTPIATAAASSTCTRSSDCIEIKSTNVNIPNVNTECITAATQMKGNKKKLQTEIDKSIIDDQRANVIETIDIKNEPTDEEFEFDDCIEVKPTVISNVNTEYITATIQTVDDCIDIKPTVISNVNTEYITATKQTVDDCIEVKPTVISNVNTEYITSTTQTAFKKRKLDDTMDEIDNRENT